MIKRILKGISNFLFIILLILLSISFYSWAQISIMHKPYSSFMGYSMFEVVTGSMSGTIEINDYIIVKETKDIKLKDIITFKEKDSLVTHRVMEIKSDSIITKGDANNSEDVELKYEDVIGKVVYVLPKGGVWKKVFTDYNVLLMLFITMTFFTIYFSLDEKNEKKKNSKKVLKQEDTPKVSENMIELPKEKQTVENKSLKSIELPKMKSVEDKKSSKTIELPKMKK